MRAVTPFLLATAASLETAGLIIHRINALTPRTLSRLKGNKSRYKFFMLAGSDQQFTGLGGNAEDTKTIR